VVCAAIEQRGRVLACRRGPGMSRGGLWELPGGKVEAGEDPRQALCRELQEELGIAVSVGPYLATSQHRYHDIEIELAAYCCAIVSGQVRPVEHDAVRWVGPAAARRLDWSPADVPLVERWAASRGGSRTAPTGRVRV
jgi:8-oxo-dGTP diphosphatase